MGPNIAQIIPQAVRLIYGFLILEGRNSCHCFCVELVNLLPVHRYSVDIFTYSGPSGILNSDGKQGNRLSRC